LIYDEKTKSKSFQIIEPLSQQVIRYVFEEYSKKQKLSKEDQIVKLFQKALTQTIQRYGLKINLKGQGYEMLAFAVLRQLGPILVKDFIKLVNCHVPTDLPSWINNATFHISTFGLPMVLGYKNYDHYLDACLSRKRNNAQDALQPQHHNETHPDLVQVNYLSSSDDFWYFAAQCKLYTNPIDQSKVQHSKRSTKSVYEKFEKFGKMPVGSLQLILLIGPNSVAKEKCVVEGNDVFLYVDCSNHKNIFPDFVIKLLEYIITCKKGSKIKKLKV